MHLPTRASRILIAISLIALAASLSIAPVIARELASAPEIRIIGFSADGRYFAYEQFEDDTVSDTAIAAIDVIDRDTGRSMAGFPFGFLGMEKNGQFPARVGDHRITINENLSGTARLAQLRADVVRETRARLDELKIDVPGQRLAGFPVTARIERITTVDFVLAPMLPGKDMPDPQTVYRATTAITPDDMSICVDSMKPVDHVIELKLEVIDDTGARAALPAIVTKTAWPSGQHECASLVRMTDVIAAPPRAQHEPRTVVVLMLAVSWGAHADTARYFAAFARLP
jgi:hypothetical protein